MIYYLYFHQSSCFFACFFVHHFGQQAQKNPMMKFNLLIFKWDSILIHIQ